MKLHEITEDWKQYLDKDGDLDLHNRRLKVLPPGLPRTFEKTFSCNFNKLTSLDGCPSHVGGNFFCDNNKLTSLDGCPSHIGAYFFCGDNKLTSLHLIHEQIEFVGGAFYALINPIKGHVLGLVLIEGLQAVYLDNKQVQGILNKHLQGDILACQDELLAAGLHDWAQL